MHFICFSLFNTQLLLSFTGCNLQNHFIVRKGPHIWQLIIIIFKLWATIEAKAISFSKMQELCPIHYLYSFFLISFPAFDCLSAFFTIFDFLNRSFLTHFWKVYFYLFLTSCFRSSFNSANC